MAFGEHVRCMANTYALILTHTLHNRVRARSISGCRVGPAFLSSQGSHPTLQGAQVLFLLMHSSAGLSGCGWLLEQQLTGVSSHISCCGLLLFDGALVLPRLLHYCRLPQCSFPAGLLIEGAPRGLHKRNPGEACMEIILPLCTIDWCAVGGWSFHACIYILLFASRYYTIRRQRFIGRFCLSNLCSMAIVLELDKGLSFAVS